MNKGALSGVFPFSPEHSPLILNKRAKYDKGKANDIKAECVCLLQADTCNCINRKTEKKSSLPEILMYNKERMLVELLRNKNKLPFDYYKEILGNYRKQINDLDIQAIQDYAYVIPKSGMIMETLQMEVL